MQKNTILTGKKRRIFHVTMNRPEVMNAINIDILRGLQNALEQLASDDEMRVLILEGAGGNFCAGADMSMLNEGWGAPEWLKVMKLFGKVIRTMREIAQPIVIKLQGAAYGGGFNLALAGDLVVASHTSRLCQSFVNIGTVLDGGGTYFLPRLVGLARARELALLGEEIDGRRAASMGLIYKSVSNEDLDAEVDALADALSKKPLSAMALIKEGLEGSLDMCLKDVLEWEASHQSVLFQTVAHKEAVRAFLRSRGKKK